MVRAALAALILTLGGVAMAQDRVPHRLPDPVVDLSVLNHKPAGRLGRVRPDGTGLVYGDGTPARFWGVNIQAAAIFQTERARVVEEARRLARLGVNVVRFHHHDSHWVRPNIFANPEAETTALSPERLDKIGWWIKALRDEGIYVWLDLHVGRRFVAGDGVQDFDEIPQEEGRADGRGFNFLNPDIEARMERFVEDYLNYVNPYTGLALKDDPAILAVLITNENDLTHHFGNGLLPDKGVPAHSARYMDAARAFADANGFDQREIWRAWEHGVSKIFLADLEARFFQRAIQHLRDLGYPGIVVPTNTWGGMSLSGLPSLTLGDMIDVHSYGDAWELWWDPDELPDSLTRISQQHVADKPLSVSEWNITPFPGVDRFTATIRTAAVAAEQGWDMVMLYGYGQQKLDDRARPNNWHAANDPAMMAGMPAAALLYRLGHVRPADPAILQLAPEDLWGRKVEAETSATIRRLARTSGLRVALPAHPALPWLQPTEIPPGARVFGDLDRPPELEAPGELRHDWQDGLFGVVTERTLALAGSLEQGASAGDLSARVDAEHAVVALQSLDAQPIAETDRLLLTLIGPTEPVRGAETPFASARLSGEIAFTARPGLALELSPGLDTGTVSLQAEGARHRLVFEGLKGALWLTFRPVTGLD